MLSVWSCRFPEAGTTRWRGIPVFLTCWKAFSDSFSRDGCRSKDFEVDGWGCTVSIRELVDADSRVWIEAASSCTLAVAEGLGCVETTVGHWRTVELFTSKGVLKVWPRAISKICEGFWIPAISGLISCEVVGSVCAVEAPGVWVRMLWDKGWCSPKLVMAPRLVNGCGVMKEGPFWELTEVVELSTSTRWRGRHARFVEKRGVSDDCGVWALFWNGLWIREKLLCGMFELRPKSGGWFGANEELRGLGNVIGVDWGNCCRGLEGFWSWTPWPNRGPNSLLATSEICDKEQKGIPSVCCTLGSFCFRYCEDWWLGWVEFGNFSPTLLFIAGVGISVEGSIGLCL